MKNQELDLESKLMMLLSKPSKGEENPHTSLNYKDGSKFSGPVIQEEIRHGLGSLSRLKVGEDSAAISEFDEVFYNYSG